MTLSWSFKLCKQNYAEHFSPYLETVTLVSLWPAADCGRWLPLGPCLLSGLWVGCLLSVGVWSCSSVWGVTVHSAPRRAGVPDWRYIMNTSWPAGIKPLCLAIWRTPWKVQHLMFGDSHNEALLCLLCSEVMVFPLLGGGKQ